MNQWFRNDRVVQAELDVFRAEQAERSGDPAGARTGYHAAGEADATVALSVPADHPNTRSDLGIAAVASLARSGDFGRAVEVAQRLLAEPDALRESGAAELRRLADEYAALIAPRASLASASANRGQAVRGAVRAQFALKRAA